ncbi:MAG: hypothetical protein ABJM62_10045, partial [Marinomonas sp.]
LLLLQKTMVMVEGIATQLNPQINMWDTSGPYVKSWIRDELGPEAAIADRLKEDAGTFLRIPSLVRRLEEQFPDPGGAPPPPPLPDVPLMWEKKANVGGSQGRGILGYIAALAAGAGALYGAQMLGWI